MLTLEFLYQSIDDKMTRRHCFAFFVGRNNQQIQEVEIKNLRTMLQQARKESFDQMMKSGERGKQIMMLERKVESQQRELFNARAKMKRLAGKQRRKPVDQPPWPEYSDDM